MVPNSRKLDESVDFHKYLPKEVATTAWGRSGRTIQWN